MSNVQSLPTARDKVGLAPVTLPLTDGCLVVPVKRKSLAKHSVTSFGSPQAMPTKRSGTLASTRKWRAAHRRGVSKPIDALITP